MRATIAARTTVGTPANRLQRLVFQSVDNALVEIDGRTERTGSFTVTLPADTQQTSFGIRRATGSGAATIRLVVIDDCGEFPTLVGGGPDAFGSGAPQAQAAPAAPRPPDRPSRDPAQPVDRPLCASRPPIRTVATPDGAGRLRVTVFAEGKVRAMSNGVRALRFGSATNARIDVADRVGAVGDFVVVLPDGIQQATFVVHRATSGRATTVPFVVVDACGEWPTIVGGGPDAF